MNLTVLLIDDDRDLTSTFAEILQLEGYKTYTAATAIDGLRLIKSVRPDIIVCDWQMPNLKGDELLREVRLSATTANLPFIVMSGYVFKDMSFKPSAVLRKPFSMDTLLSTIQQVIEIPMAVS